MKTIKFLAPLFALAAAVGFAAACAPIEEEDFHADPFEPPLESPDADGGPPDLCAKISPWCRYTDQWDPDYPATYTWPNPMDPTGIAIWGQPKCYCMCEHAPDPQAFCAQKIDAMGNPSPTGTPAAADCGTLLAPDPVTGNLKAFFPGGYPPVCRKTTTTVP